MWKPVKFCDTVRKAMPNIFDNEMYTVLDPLLTRSGRKTLRPCMKNAKNAEKPRFLPNRVSFRPKIDKIIILYLYFCGS